MSYISPWRLLRLADELCEPDAGRGRPRPINLRRALSTAYYAVFHRISLNVVRHVLFASFDQQINVARYISHAAVKEVCTWIGGGKTPPQYFADLVVTLRANEQLTAVTQAFLTLHDQREKADYDHTAAMYKASVISNVQLARRAVETAFATVDDPDFQSFYGLIALKTSIKS